MDRIIVVTGVTSGIGKALTERLAAQGNRIYGVGRRPDALDAMSERLGDRFVPIVADLADPEARQRGIEQIRSDAPQIDALVNNAAECVYQSATELNDERWRQLFETNVLAAIDLTRQLVPAMAPGAQVLNVSSVTSRGVAHPRFGAYGLTKAALAHFTDSLRQELVRHGVRVALVSPGLVDTPIYGKVDGFERQEERLRQAMPQWLEPEDLAETIDWMLSRPVHVAVTDVTIMPTGQVR